MLTRIWCLFEIWKTAAVKTVTGLQIVMTSDINIGQAEKIFHELDVAKAEATNAADRDRILVRFWDSKFKLHVVSLGFKDICSA